MEKRKHDGWIIKGDGWNRGPHFYTFAVTRSECIGTLTENHETDWKTLYRRGYRCVKVHVNEIHDGPMAVVNMNPHA